MRHGAHGPIPLTAPEPRAYGRRDLRRAVSLAAVLGWAAVAGPFLLAVPGALPFAALIGLPIAFVACWAIGAPVLWRLMRRPIGWAAAALWGAAIAAAMSVVRVALGRFLGWRQSLDDSFDSQIGGGAYIREVDGILTAYGWWLLAGSVGAFVLSGAATALLVRAAIGPGRAPPPQGASADSPP